MKQIIMGFALILAVVFTATAQEKRTGHKSDMSSTELAEEKTDKMSEVLKLSNRQSKSLYSINLKHIESMRNLKENSPKRSKEEHESKRAKRSEKRDAFINDIRPVLTADQIKKLEIHIAERKEKHGEIHKEKRAHGSKGEKHSLNEGRERSRDDRQHDSSKRDHSKKGLKDLPAEDRAELITEKLTKALDLSAEQQRQIADISNKHSEKNQAGRDEKREGYEKKFEAFKAERAAYETAVMNILKEEQIPAFKELIEKRGEHRGGKWNKGKKEHR